jgi:hypothetical protein
MTSSDCYNLNLNIRMLYILNRITYVFPRRLVDTDSVVLLQYTILARFVPLPSGSDGLVDWSVIGVSSGIARPWPTSRSIRNFNIPRTS